MASEAKKADSTSKKDSAAADTKATTADASKPADSSSAASDGAPKNYSRGEGQKPVTQAYKDNWNLIFGKKKKKP